MDRWACVNIPRFPLQLLLRRHPEWKQVPVVVVTRDAPTGEITRVNDQAIHAGIRPGMRYAAAGGLIDELRAGVIAATEIEQGIVSLTKRLKEFSPEVEPSSGSPGVFWLNAAGMTSLYPSLHAWARAIAAATAMLGFPTAVVVGFTRFGTYAVAKTRNGVTVFDDPERERAAARRVPLTRLDLAPDFAGMMTLLGVETIGEFLRLPAAGLRQRFEDEAYELHRRASGDLQTPLQSHKSIAPLYREENLDHPETNSTRLLAVIANMVGPLVHVLEKRGEALAEARWMMFLETKEHRIERVRTAAPTSDMRQIMDLVRLHLQSVSLLGGVEKLMVAVIGAPAVPKQETFLPLQFRRDLVAGGRALARIRAYYGEYTTVTAILEDGHLPESRFRWEPLRRIKQPHPSPPHSRMLVRRVYAEPKPLLPNRKSELVHTLGPFIFSGNWWADERYREYHFVETRTGKLIWVYYDHVREGWFIHGEVE